MKRLLTHYLATKSAKYNEVLVKDNKLTEKGEKVVNTWLKLAECQNNDALITLPEGDGRVFGVTEYSVIAGKVYKVINFSTEVAMTKEAQPARKWVVTEEKITVDEKKLVSPTMLNDLVQEWVDSQNGLTITLQAIAKERKLISDFKFLYKDDMNFYVVGSPTAGGIDENVVFFRKVQFKESAFNEYYTTFNHYTNYEERLNWITRAE